MMRVQAFRSSMPSSLGRGYVVVSDPSTGRSAQAKWGPDVAIDQAVSEATRQLKDISSNRE